MYIPDFSVSDAFDKAPRETQKAALSLIEGLMLESPRVPEEKKLCFRIVRAYEQWDDKLMDSIQYYGEPSDSNEEDALRTQVRREFLAFIEHIQAELEQFRAEHPIPTLPKTPDIP